MCINQRQSVKQQMDYICFEHFLEIDTEDTVKGLYSYNDKVYLPICKYSAKDDGIQQALQSIIQVQSNAKGIATPLAYILGEIICNVAQHAGCEKVYVSSFYDKSAEIINLCIADTGIGIYSSYIKANKYLSEINDNEAEALRIANEGYSTKNLPTAENRGFGISTTRNMVVKGLGGTFSILSGSALQLSTAGKENVFIQLPQNVEWQGTMVFIQLPRQAREDFQYINYLE